MKTTEITVQVIRQSDKAVLVSAGTKASRFVGNDFYGVSGRVWIAKSQIKKMEILRNNFGEDIGTTILEVPTWLVRKNNIISSDSVITNQLRSAFKAEKVI